jgi:hypothetical protein
VDRSLLLPRPDPRASYTCSSAALLNHEPQLPRHVPRSVAARAPSIKHQWDTETAKQVKMRAPKVHIYGWHLVQQAALQLLIFHCIYPTHVLGFRPRL